MAAERRLRIAPGAEIAEDELEEHFIRSSGPGGQNVNKVASKAVLRWPASASGLLDAESLDRLKTSYPAHMTKDGELVVSSQATRDAIKNRAACLDKLKAMLLVAVKRPKRRIPTRPTKGSVRRRLNAKSRHSQKKRDRRDVFDD